MSEEHGEPIRKKISTLKLHISSNTAILTVDDEVIIENLLKIDENFTIFRKFFEILKTSSVEKVFLINLSMNSIFLKEFPREISGINTNFEVKNVIFDDKTTTNVVISIINKCTRLNEVFMRGFMMETGNFHNKFFYEAKWVHSLTRNLEQLIDESKLNFKDFKLYAPYFVSFLKTFAEKMPMGTEIFIETPFGKEKSKRAFKDLVPKNYGIYGLRLQSESEESDGEMWTQKLDNRIILKCRPFGVYCSVEDNAPVLLQNNPRKCKKRKIQPKPLSPVKLPNVKIDWEHLIEKYFENEELLENEKELSESKTNWNDLPVEMKLKCIEKMTEKTKVLLRGCSKLDKSIVDKEKKHFKVLEFYDEIRFDSRITGTCRAPYRVYEVISKTILSTVDSSRKSVVQAHLVYCDENRDGGSETDGHTFKRVSLYKYLSNLFENSQIETLKIELREKSEWWNCYSENGKEPRKVENFEVDSEFPYDEMFEISMKFNPNSIRLIGEYKTPFSGLFTFIQRMIDEDWKIGRKIEFSSKCGSNRGLEEIFGDQSIAENLTDELKMNLVSNDEKHFRLAMKEDLTKHIVVLYCLDETIQRRLLHLNAQTLQLAVISKDLTQIPHSFF